MKNYTIINETHLDYFSTFLENNQIKNDIQSLEKYSCDQTENLYFKPSLILFPKSTQEVSKIVTFCNKNNIPITPRGAGTGLTGGALPVFGGIVISLEKMNQILKIDTQNFQVTIQPGVINYHLQETLEPYGLFYPPDPSSWGSSFIGGNIATNAGGPKAVKYGVTSAYVLNLEVVLPNGEIIWTGANTLKNSTGLNLTQLFVGSEGTLGIITQAVLKIQSKPKFDCSILIPFYFVNECAKAVAQIYQHNLNPCALELMERNALEQANLFLEDSTIILKEGIEAHLLIMFDGNSQNEILNEIQKTIDLLDKFKIDEIYFADNESDKNKIWYLRRKVAEIVKSNGFTLEEDIVVPRAELPELINFVHKLSKKHNFKVVCYGHAGDGNLHVRINHPIHKNSYKNAEIESILKELFEFVHSINGTISGEHGIGLIQKKYLNLVFNNANLNLQKSIKLAIDPNQIMNPEKIYI